MQRNGSSVLRYERQRIAVGGFQDQVPFQAPKTDKVGFAPVYFRFADHSPGTTQRLRIAKSADAGAEARAVVRAFLFTIFGLGVQPRAKAWAGESFLSRPAAPSL